MRAQYKTILQSAMTPMIPAFQVKIKRTFPTEYRKRCSELVKLGLLKNLGLKIIDGHFYGSFVITKKGKNLIPPQLRDKGKEV